MKNVNMKVISLGLGVSMMMGGFSSCLVYPIKAAAGSVGASLPVSSTGLPTPPPLPASTGLPTPPPLPVSTGLPTPPPLPASTGLPTPPPLPASKPSNSSRLQPVRRTPRTNGSREDKMETKITFDGVDYEVEYNFSSKGDLRMVIGKGSSFSGELRGDATIDMAMLRVFLKNEKCGNDISKKVDELFDLVEPVFSSAKRAYEKGAPVPMPSEESMKAKVKEAQDYAEADKLMGIRADEERKLKAEYFQNVILNHSQRVNDVCRALEAKQRESLVEKARKRAQDVANMHGTAVAEVDESSICISEFMKRKCREEARNQVVDEVVESDVNFQLVLNDRVAKRVQQVREDASKRVYDVYRSLKDKKPNLDSSKDNTNSIISGDNKQGSVVQTQLSKPEVELEKARSAAKEAEAKKDAHENEIAQLKAELEEARNAAKEAEAKKNARENEIAQLKAELEEARNAAKEAEAKKNARENEIAQLKAELEKTKSTTIQEAAIAKTLKKSNEGLNAELRNAKDAIKRYGTELGKVIEEAGDSTATVEIDVARIKGLKENSEALTAKLGEVTKEAEKQTERIRTLETRNAQLNASRSNVFVETSNNAGNNGDSVAGVRITDMNLIDGVEYVPLQVNVAENKSDKLQQNAKVLVQLPEDERRNIREAVKMINENVKVSGDNNGLVIDGTFVGGSSVVVNKNDLVKYGKKIRVSFEVKNENTGMFEELGSQEVDTSRNLKINKLAGTMRMKVTPVA